MAGIIILAGAYVLSQFYRSFLAVLTPILSQDLGATSTDLSLASGMWFAAFALMQFPVGIGLDRYGPRRTAGWILLIAGGGGALLFAFAASPWMLVVAMTLIGMGCAPILMAAMYIFAKTLRPNLFAVAASWVMATGMAGNIVGASPLAMVVEWLGWRGAMLGFAVLTLAVAALILLIVKDPAQDDGAGASGLSGYLEVARLKVIWPILPFLMLNGVIANGIRGLWAGPFLFELHGADPISIGNVTLFMALSMVVASLVFGPLDTVFGTRKWVVAAGGATAVAACAFLAFHPQSSMAVITFAFMFAGVSLGVFGVLMAHLRSFFPPHLLGRGVTAMNFLGMAGVGLMQVITGQIVRAASDPADPARSYEVLFTVYAVTVGLALLVYLFSRDAKPGLVTADSRSSR